MNRSDSIGNASKNNGKYSVLADASSHHQKSQSSHCQTKQQVSGDKTSVPFQCNFLPGESTDLDLEETIWKSAENIHISNDQASSYNNQNNEDHKSLEYQNKRQHKLSSSASTAAILQHVVDSSYSDGNETFRNSALEVPGSQNDERNASPIPSNIDVRKNQLSVQHNSSTGTPSPRLRSQSPNHDISIESSDEKEEKYDNFNQSVSREGSFERSTSFQEGILDHLTQSDKTELKTSESLKSLDQSRNLDSSGASGQTLLTGTTKEKKDSRDGKSTDKKSRKAWYNVLNPNYKSRSEDLKRLFKELPSDERLIVDYSCALQKDILVHGRLYVTPNYFCFYSKIFGWETFSSIKCKDIVSITKEKTALVIPNALQINTDSDKYFFTSFAARDKTYLMLFRIWQNALIGQQVSTAELWQWVHSSYGEELGLTSDDDDYVAPSTEDDMKSTAFVPLIDPNIESAEEKFMKISSIDSTEDVSQPESNQEALVRRSAMDGKEKKMSSSRKSPLRTSSIQQFDVEPPIDILYSLLPSDLSDSNDSEPKSSKLSGTQNETVTCPDIASHHQGREVINTVIGLPIDDVFTLLFTNSKFMFDLHLARKTYDVVASNWQSNPDTNQKIRQVTYTVTLPTNSFGPKVSHVTETQVISAFSKPSEIYTVDAEACNGGIPYADYFSVSNHWCLTKESTNETRLNVWTEVKYKKNVWGFMKNVIDKNAFSGMKCLLKDMNDSLLQEVDKGVQKPVRRRRRRALSKCSDNIDALPILGDKVKDAHKSTQVPSRKTTLPLISATGLTATPESPVRSAALLFLCVLLGVNAFLYYRLYALEDKMVNGGRTPSVTFDPALFKRSEDVTVQEWVKILHEQEALHSSEVDRWKKAVSEAADYLKKAEESLRNLHASIPHNQASKVQSLLRHLKLLQQIQQSEKPLADKLKAPDEGILPSEEL